MKKEELLRRIDELTIYDKDFDTIVSLMNNSDPRLFVKIIEEVVNGNLKFSDFERVFNDKSYSDILAKNLEVQHNLRNEILRTIDYRKNILGENYDLDYKNGMVGVPVQYADSSLLNFYNTIKAEDTAELAYQLFDVRSTDDDLLQAIKAKLYSTVSGNEDKLLFYANQYIVPIDPSYQVINYSDEIFMTDNNITEDQMKKIKALSIYLRRRDA
jgi:hypothetical protein